MYWCLTRILPGGVNNFRRRGRHRPEATPGSMHSLSLGRNSAVTSTSSEQTPRDPGVHSIAREITAEGVFRGRSGPQVVYLLSPGPWLGACKPQRRFT